MLWTDNLREWFAVRNEKADGYGPQMDLSTGNFNGPCHI